MTATTGTVALYTQPGGTSKTNPGSSGPIDTHLISNATLDVNVASLTGGTSPSITFSVSRLGSNGLWYPVWTSAAIVAAGTTSINLGPDTATPMIFSSMCRFDWAFGGVAPPASVAFGVSFVGRN